MKNPFKFSTLLILLGFVFAISSCEENLEVDCDNYDVQITYDLDSLGAVLTAVVSNGTPEYNYLWSTGEITSSIVVNAEGAYSVTVTDGNDCTDEATFDVSFTIDCSTFVADMFTTDSILFATSQGGTEPYIYEWSEGSTTSSIDIFDEGTYEVTITDANGCVSTATTTVEFDPCSGFNGNINILFDSINNVTILVGYATGGTAPYSYEWSNGVTTPETTVNSFGLYTLTITDAEGCVFEVSVVYEDPCLSYQIEIIAQQDSSNLDNYLLKVKSLNGSPFGSYLWSTGATTSEITVQPSGWWSVTTTNVLGCVATDYIQL